MTRYFHFTLGPVQGFVAQARRTRDFWAGSFLLSYLAGVAMLETQKQDGKIIFPEPDPNYLSWIENGHGPGQKPKHGGIPNRFMAQIPDGFGPAKVGKAVKSAWHELAEQVWLEDLQPFLKQKGFDEKPIRDLWIRQIDGFWDISWAILPIEHADNTSILDRRKNWRSHYLQPEPGQKCMMMDGMQELSGAEKPGEGKGFWEALRQSGKRRIQTDLRDGERLSAIAYVKRRFVHYFAGFSAAMPSGWTAKGWPVKPGAESVVSLAAKPWLEKAKQNPAAQSALREFYMAARVLSSETETTSEPYDWSSIEELAFYEADLRNRKLYPERDETPNRAQANQTLLALTKLQEVADLGDPSPYYALLLMDGDSLGKHMSDPNKRKRELISDALNRFTHDAQAIVEKDQQGFLVYAGGDDVLALLTLDQALPRAAALREAYAKAFNEARAARPEVEWFPATISAAIQFAHYRLPFIKVRADAHDLLDDVAKDGRGRDAVAVRVWKQSGLHLTWAQPWVVAFGEQGSGSTAQPDGQVWLAKIARDLASDEDSLRVASGFFYRLRERFKLLKPDKDSKAEGIDHGSMVELLAYEYVHSGIHEGKMSQKEAKASIEPLLAQCRPKHRTEIKDSKPTDFEYPADTPARYEADAALLVRFLASHGKVR